MVGGVTEGERVVGIDLGKTKSTNPLPSGSRSKQSDTAIEAAAKRRNGVEIVVDANGQRTFHWGLFHEFLYMFLDLQSTFFTLQHHFTSCGPSAIYVSSA